jgi:uncharacterized membrane protein YhaH (DUF805 family)
MIDLLLSFKDRIARKPFWLATLGLIAIDLIVHLALVAILGSTAYDAANRETRLLKVVDLIVTSPLYWPTAALLLKRLHDFGQGWGLFSAVAIIMILFTGFDFMNADIPSYITALVFIVLWIAAGATPGTPGENQYGPNPLEQGRRQV